MVDSDLVEDRGEELGRDLSLGKNIHFDKGAFVDPLKNSDSKISNPIKLANQRECDEDALQAGTCAVTGLKTTLSSNVDPVNFHSCETEHSTDEHNGPRSELQAVKYPSPVIEREDIEKSIRLAELRYAVGDSTSGFKPLKIKSLSKKTLGSRLNLCEGDATNQKGTTFNKTVPANDSAPSVSSGRKDREHKEVLSSAKVEVPPADNAESSKETDDAGTPENKEYDELNVLKATQKPSGKKTRSNKSTSAENDVDVKGTKGPKYLMKRSKTTNVVAKRAVISPKVAKRKKSENDKKKNVETENGKGLPVTGEPTVLALDHELNSMDVDNENRHVIGGQNMSYNEGHAGGKSPRCGKKPLKPNVANPLQVTEVGTERRDSHQWSYEAFGRWILKSDYLTASNEAGKFLDED
ncbi:hypothetical protein K7X08_008422 [Anisodus acutangulus]|uniref:Uncharacterized protein n=1 Tax=Anisodus acutangulus TaxID=402998 RepID=A0A9Q1MUG4_9SOLA|nr:hypothetical protein K7X08_008422 [Anisodus acutangulus]